MKKHCVLFILLVAFAFGSIAQSSMSLPVMIKNEDGSVETYDIQKGDKLVYQVKAGGSEYEFIVTLNNPGSNALDFNYEMTNTNNTRGHVTISNEAKSSATKYVNFFRGGEMKLTDACTVWLSDKNFSDMAQGRTTMQLDNHAAETFYSPDENEVSMPVKIKNQKKYIQGFFINNAADGKGTQTLYINNISGNALILKMDLGWSIELKEIR